jgi:hypothetical protein
MYIFSSFCLLRCLRLCGLHQLVRNSTALLLSKSKIVNGIVSCKTTVIYLLLSLRQIPECLRVNATQSVEYLGRKTGVLFYMSSASEVENELRNHFAYEQ